MDQDTKQFEATEKRFCNTSHPIAISIDQTPLKNLASGLAIQHCGARSPRRSASLVCCMSEGPKGRGEESI